MRTEETELKPRRGAIARCSLGTLGLITSDGPVPVKYSDGSTGMAWVGSHLTDDLQSTGKTWSSRHPRVIRYIEDVPELLEAISAEQFQRHREV